MRRLTKKEKHEVERFLGYGLPDRAIAKSLNLSTEQIASFRRNHRLPHVYKSDEMSPYTLYKFGQVLDRLIIELNQ